MSQKLFKSLGIAVLMILAVTQPVYSHCGCGCEMVDCCDCGFWESECGCDVVCRDSCSLYLGAEGLWWNTCQTNLDFAVDVTGTDEATRNELVGPGKTHYLEYDWRGGIRGWLGFRGMCGWDIRVTYTYHENEAKDSVTGESGVSHLKAVMLHAGTGDDLDEALSAEGDQDLKYQTLDLIFGRQLFFCGGTLMLEPFFGARGLKLEQDLEVLYQGEDFATTPAKILYDSELEAAGLYAGIDMNYSFCPCLRIYGTFAGSALYGHTDDHHRQQLLNTNLVVTTTEIDVKDKQCDVVPGYHLRAGASWGACCGRCFAFQISLGYEFNHWFNTPQLRRYYDNVHEGVAGSATDGQITAHGATLALELAF